MTQQVQITFYLVIETPGKPTRPTAACNNILSSVGFYTLADYRSPCRFLFLRYLINTIGDGENWGRHNGNEESHRKEVPNKMVQEVEQYDLGRRALGTGRSQCQPVSKLPTFVDNFDKCSLIKMTLFAVLSRLENINTHTLVLLVFIRDNSTSLIGSKL